MTTGRYTGGPNTYRYGTLKDAIQFPLEWKLTTHKDKIVNVNQHTQCKMNTTLQTMPFNFTINKKIDIFLQVFLLGNPVLDELLSSVVDPEWFFSDPIPDPDPTFQRVSDPIPDPDPIWICRNLHIYICICTHTHMHTHYCLYVTIIYTIYIKKNPVSLSYHIQLYIYC